MKACTRVLVLLGVSVALAIGSGAAQGSQNEVGFSVWHRLNADQSNPAPEHERLSCVQGRLWLCRYDKVPEPALNFSWNSTTGYFAGRDITSSWTCPTWFPSTVCASVSRVVEGQVIYLPAAGPVGSPRLTDLVFSGSGSNRLLSFYWVSHFECPWYPSFALAISANPFPLPFNGVDWPKQDCIAP